MPVLTIRNIPDEVHVGLKRLAVEHGNSTEAEIRDILRHAVRPPSDIRVGSELAAFGRDVGGLDLDAERRFELSEAADFG